MAPGTRPSGGAAKGSLAARCLHLQCCHQCLRTEPAWHQALGLLAGLQAAHWRPGVFVFTYNAAINACGQTQHGNRRSAFRRGCKGLSGCQVLPCRHLCLRTDPVGHQALGLLAVMQVAPWSPSVITYNAAICACGPIQQCTGHSAFWRRRRRLIGRQLYSPTESGRPRAQWLTDV